MKHNIDLKDIYEAIQDFRDEVREVYVTKDEFLPVKLISFGMVAIVLTTVVGVIINGVIRTIP